MRVLVVQHVPFEGPGLITEWAHERGHSAQSILALREEFPAPGAVDLLVVMGGPMAADDNAGNPWLLAEKRFIVSAIESGCAVLGVCLGAQILAEVLGGRVRRSGHREIGWLPVTLTEEGRRDPLFADWPSPLTVGLWHGDTFDLPAGIEPTLSSAACRNQAFSFEGRVVGLQFHAEWTQPDLETLVAACGEETLVGGPYVVPAEQLLAELPDHLGDCRELLFRLLDRLAGARR
jgi:GMP synthase-like glutamine amidotransferase